MAVSQIEENISIESVPNQDPELYAKLNDPLHWMDLPLDDIVPRSARFASLKQLIAFCRNEENNLVDKVLALDYYDHRSIICWRTDQPSFKTLIDRIIVDFLQYKEDDYPAVRDQLNLDTLDIYQVFADVDQTFLKHYVQYYLNGVIESATNDEDYYDNDITTNWSDLPWGNKKNDSEVENEVVEDSVISEN